MIPRLLLASLRRRFRQTLVILVAVTFAAATVAAMVAFSQRAAGGFDEELAAFGANLVVRPQVGGPASLPWEEVERVRALPGVVEATGVPAAHSDAGIVRIEVRAERERLSAVAEEIEQRVAGVEATPLLRVSVSEAALVHRLTLLLGAVAVIACLLAVLSVGASTTALVEERRTEIGLFMALGFTAPRVAAIFAAELLVLALVAGVAGDVLGELAALQLVRSVLGQAAELTLPAWTGLIAAALAAIVVVGLSMVVALAHIGRLDAARVLKGE